MILDNWTALRQWNTSNYSPEEQLEDRCTICLQEIVQTFVLPCHHSFCLDCISSWLEGRAKDCPLCRRTVFYSTIMAIERQTLDPDAPSYKAHEDYQKLDDELGGMVTDRLNTAWVNLYYTVSRDRTEIQRSAWKLQILDRKIVSISQKRLSVLRGYQRNVWNDVRIWRETEECRRITGIDLNNAAARYLGFRNIEGHDVEESPVRIVKTAAYWIFANCLEIAGWR